MTDSLMVIHDRLGSMIDQVGQPDYSLREMVEGLRQIRDDLFKLSETATSGAEWSAERFERSRRLARDGYPVPAEDWLMLEAARQYHMAQITRLERAITTEVLTSEEVVSLALSRLSDVASTACSGWTKHEDIPNISAEHVFHAKLHLPLVTRTPDGAWWTHPPLGAPSSWERK